MTELDIKEIAKQIKPKDQKDISDYLRKMAQEYKEKESREKEEDA